MRLTALTIKNFKGIDERGVRVEFAPITLLFGPNNAGKSTVIQALHLAREVFCHPDMDLDKVAIQGKGLDLGGFHHHRWRGGAGGGLLLAGVAGGALSRSCACRSSWDMRTAAGRVRPRRVCSSATLALMPGSLIPPRSSSPAR